MIPAVIEIAASKMLDDGIVAFLVALHVATRSGPQTTAGTILAYPFDHPELPEEIRKQLAESGHNPEHAMAMTCAELNQNPLGMPTELAYCLLCGACSDCIGEYTKQYGLKEEDLYKVDDYSSDESEEEKKPQRTTIEIPDIIAWMKNYIPQPAWQTCSNSFRYIAGT